jgi:hypothetical protein
LRRRFGCASPIDSFFSTKTYFLDRFFGPADGFLLSSLYADSSPEYLLDDSDDEEASSHSLSSNINKVQIKYQEWLVTESM